jgi:lambda family phage portal protein
MGQPVTKFEFKESGSRVLREFNAQRQLEKALHQRSRTAMRTQGFAGAAVTRLTASLSQMSESINADLDGSLVILRSRARSLCANYEFGRRFLSLVASNVIGPCGPTLQVRATRTDGKLDKSANDAIETHWALWCKKADVTGRMSLARLLQVIIKSVARDGEALVRVIRNRDMPYGIGLQLLEADRLDESINTRLQNGNVVRMGVELNSLSRPVALYVMTAHPGDRWAPGGKKVERVDVRDLYHIYLPERAEQVRGYTWLHAVLIRAANTSGYEEAAIVAARVGASKMGVFTMDPDKAPGGDLSALADGKDAATGNLQMTAEPGEFFQLPAGYDLKSWDPEYPHANFESFMLQCMRGMASGLDVATHNLSGNMRDVNYSSARIAELAEREIWMMLQDWLIGAFLKPLFDDWLASALIRKEVTFPSGSALPADKFTKFSSVARFQGRRWTWVDPKNDVQTAREQIAEGLNSRTRIAAAQGMEFEDIVDELAQEEVLMTAAKLPRTASKPAAEVPPPADETV